MNNNGHSNGKQFQTRLDTAVQWPPSISEAGMYGIAGEFIRLIGPHTEADPNALLLAFLTFAGNLIGRNYYIPTGPQWQCGNLYLCIVGATGNGRKGSAISAAETFFKRGEHAPKLGHVVYGISSGEGVIHKVRDPKIKRQLNKKTNQEEDTLIDKGVEDKRVVFCLSEFQQYIANMRRQDSTLSSVIRQAWDRGEIASPSKNDEVAATNAHISAIACISKEEFLQEYTQSDAHNGNLNRWMLALSQRSKLLPEGGDFESLFESPQWSELQRRFNENTRKVETFPRRLSRQNDTQDDWGRDQCSDRGLYKALSEERPGILGAIAGRAPQQVIRMSLIHAVINGHPSIEPSDQAAAYECWRYCEDSCKYIFGNAIEDPRAVQMLIILRANPAGLGWNDLHRKLHCSSDEAQEALKLLTELSLVYFREHSTGGRPGRVWFPTL